MRISLLAVILAFCLPLRAQVVHLYVDSSAAGGGTGASWSAPLKLLSDAVTIANSASTANRYEIHVAKGTYYPTGLQSATNRDSAFLITRGGVRILGGYPSGGGVRNPGLNEAILSGAIGTASRGDNSRHVMIVCGIARTEDSVQLDGLTITGGTADSGRVQLIRGTSIDPKAGGGLYSTAIENNAFIITNCSFHLNGAEYAGGAVFSNNAAPVISGSLFENDTAGLMGGAIANFGGANAGWAIVLQKCVFRHNAVTQQSAWLGGGAVFDRSYQSERPPLFDSCVFDRNSSQGVGGGVFCQGAPRGDGFMRFMHHCAFISNVANHAGGGACIEFGQSQYVMWALDSCVFRNNSAGVYGGGLYADYRSLSPSYVADCIFEGNTADMGGGLFPARSTNFSRCRFIYNRARLGGGTSLMGKAWGGGFEACIFSGNTASEYGGGVYLDNYQYRENQSHSCLFTGNFAGIAGGAFCDSNARQVFDYSTFSGNSAASGNAIYHRDSSSLQILRSIIWDGNGTAIAGVDSSPVIRYSIVEGGYPGAGNYSANPAFINPVPISGAPTALGNYRLSKCSPAIDTISARAGGLDLDRNPRLYGRKADLGAYEYQGTSAWPDIYGPDSLCVLNADTLRHLYPSGHWSSSDTSIAIIDTNGYFRSKLPGTVTISYALAGGACPGLDTLSLTILPLPTMGTISGPLTMCRDSVSRWTAAVAGGSWFSSDTALATVDTAGNVSALDTGTVSIGYRISTAFGCTDDVRQPVRIIACAAAGVPAAGSRQARLAVVPNPSTSDCKAVFSLPEAGAFSIHILDLTGRVIRQQQGKGAPGEQELSLDTRSLTPGVYFIRLISENGQAVVRWVLQ